MITPATSVEEQAAAAVVQAIPDGVTVPEARRILDAVRAFVRQLNTDHQIELIETREVAEQATALGEKATAGWQRCQLALQAETDRAQKLQYHLGKTLEQLEMVDFLVGMGDEPVDPNAPGRVVIREARAALSREEVT